MNTHKKFPTYVLIAGTLFAVATTAMSLSTPKLGVSRQQKEVRQITALPPVISKIKNLEVVGVSINNLGEPGAEVAIEVRNNTDRAIVAIAVEQGDDKNAFGVSKDGYRMDGPPVIVLEPHGTITVELGLSSTLSISDL